MLYTTIWRSLHKILRNTAKETSAFAQNSFECFIINCQHSNFMRKRCSNHFVEWKSNREEEHRK